ncbi:hypothetical protein MTP99_008491 [Tenebrio molitor]|nr:hypothetical protein MTP99_008491 [Tenebrio molitor]
MCFQNLMPESGRRRNKIPTWRVGNQRTSENHMPYLYFFSLCRELRGVSVQWGTGNRPRKIKDVVGSSGEIFPRGEARETDPEAEAEGFWLKPNALVADLFSSLQATTLPLDEDL